MIATAAANNGDISPTAKMTIVQSPASKSRILIKLSPRFSYPAAQVYQTYCPPVKASGANPRMCATIRPMRRPEPTGRYIKRYGTIPEDEADRIAEHDAPCPLDEDGNPLYCWAKRRQGPGRCHRPAGWGTPHAGAGQCKNHGGNMPNNVKSAHLEIARREVDRLGLSLDMDPHEALLANVKLQAGHVAFFQRQVYQMDPNDLTEGGPGAMWYALLRDAQKDLTVAASSAARAGVEERQVRLAESQAEHIAAGMRGMLEDLNIEITPDVVEIMKRHLLELSSINPDTATLIFGEDAVVLAEEFQQVEAKLKSDVEQISKSEPLNDPDENPPDDTSEDPDDPTDS